MVTDQLQSLNPLDGRYRSKSTRLVPFFSEDALIRYRIKVECAYLIALSTAAVAPTISPSLEKRLQTLHEAPTASQQVKDFEAKTHHDVKAVEYFIAENLQGEGVSLIPFIHFGLTSEDTNNLAYRLMLKDAVTAVLNPELRLLLRRLAELADTYKDLAMVARTHGQPAIPTTLGKEIAVFLVRLLEQCKRLDEARLYGKCNGAVGGYQAASFALPNVDWLDFSEQFVTNLGLAFRPLTTQSNYPEDLTAIFSIFQQINSILIDLSQDFWRYISDDWLLQKGKTKYVGSSTMPQKVNPIEFENAEGNLGLANAVFEFFSRKLPISRLQRDLSDSTVMRNLGTAFGYSLVAYSSLLKGLEKIEPNQAKIVQDLESNYAILTEAWQTKARALGTADAYETVAKKVRGKMLTQADWKTLSSGDPSLQQLTPRSYLGYSTKLAVQIVMQTKRYLETAK